MSVSVLAASGIGDQPLSGTARPNRVERLPTPAELARDFPVSAALRSQIGDHRDAVRRILNGEDDRLLVVVGPCSIHDPEAALDYGRRLAELAREIDDRVMVVMRAYLEKPRTTVGWKGLLYDPDRTGQGNLREGLIRSRQLLLQLAELGLPLATEALSPLAMNYVDDLISWVAIGARTTESQIHREMVSGLPIPTGLKNGTDGDTRIALNAMASAAGKHCLFGQTDDGQPAMIETPGNPDTHLVLRGGRGITNYDHDSLVLATEQLQAAGLNTAIMVDCSHDNACKDHERQPHIAREVLSTRANGMINVCALMLESFLEDGRQNDVGPLVYGQSITDACIGWETTEVLLRECAGLNRS